MIHSSNKLCVINKRAILSGGCEMYSDLTHLERKVMTVLQHHNKRGHITTLDELEIRLGHPASKIKRIIDDLIQRGWITVKEGQWIVIRKLF